MGPATLVAMATRTAIYHRASIFDFADLPYKLVRPILKRLDNPEQLQEIEVNCPQIAKDDSELWAAFLDRDVPGWQQKYQAKIEAGRSIDYRLYRKFTLLKKKDEAAAEKALKEQFQALDDKKKLNETHITSKPLPIPIEYEGGRKINFNAARSLTYGARSQSSRGTATGAKNGIAAIRRKVAEAAKARRIQRPTTKMSADEVLRNAKAQIKQAPSSMVVDLLPLSSRSEFLQKAPIVQPSTTKIVAPRAPSHRRPPEQRMTAEANRIIEAELRQRKAPTSAAPAESRPTAAIIPGVKPAPPPTPKKRAAASVFMPTKKRKV